MEQPVDCADCPSASPRDNYFPLTEDSWWIYDTEVKYFPDDFYRSVDTVRVDTIYTLENIDYRILTSNTYFMDLVRKKDDVYFKRTLSCGFGPEYPFLKENFEQNTTIEFHDLPYTGATDVILSLQRLPVLDVNGRDYFDVIRVSEAYGSFVVNTYYANNVGMIKKEHSSDEYSMSMTIKDHHVIR